VLNTFTWGPDGWLYGCHGVFCPSNVGKPGTPENERQWMDAGVWRYHPTRHVFEVFTEGGSNPWGIDFNEQGVLFAEMCVIPHFWHMIQGARIERQGGEHFAVGPEELRRYSKGRGKPVHPHIYDDIKQHGDHVHWAGQAGPHAANARSDAAGGGHAHAGVMSYLGESWPAEYRGKLIIGNIHGQRLNLDIPVREGSGYIGKHGKDFLNFNDIWSQTLNQLYDQDGSVYIIDWYDKNQCHHNREDGHDRSNGRIYKIVHNNQKTTRIDLAKLSEEDLVKLVPSKNEFMSRQARRLLQDRSTNGGLQPSSTSALRRMLNHGKDTATKLRALWALHVTGGFDAATAIANLRSSDEWVRAWTIQLAFESRENLQRLIQEANDKQLKADLTSTSWQKRILAAGSIVIASAAQRMPSDEFRAGLVKRLLAHGEDATDHNLPLMYWFAMELLVPDNPGEWLTAALDEGPQDSELHHAAHCRAGHLRSPGSDRGKTGRLDRDAETIGHAGRPERGAQRTAPRSHAQGLVCHRGEAGASSSADVRTLAQTLSLTFGSQNALRSLRRALSDSTAPIAARRAALDSLVSIKDAELPATLQALLRDASLRGPALRALAGYNDPKTPEALLAAYDGFDAAQKRDALNTLVSRPAFAQALLAAVADDKVSSKDLTADVIRQLRILKDAELQRQLTKIYGTTREVSEDKRAEIDRYRRLYSAGGSQPGNASSGRLVFNKVCAQCHTLFDSGGKVGPDITGANRTDVTYLLETILDPNAVIPNEYRTAEIETKDGRSLTGVVKQRDDTKVVLQTANELLTIRRMRS
jgi:putative membrane-bound dehydrogenase-like protein